MIFGNITDKQAVCLAVMHVFIFFVVIVSMLCLTVNKESMTGHFLLMDAMFTFLILNSCVFALESVLTTPMYIYAADRRFRMRGVIAASAVESAVNAVVRGAIVADLMGAARQGAPAAREGGGSEAGVEKPVSSEAGSEGSDKPVPSEAGTEGSDNVGEGCDKVVGDTDSAASGANTHVIM